MLRIQLTKNPYGQKPRGDFVAVLDIGRVYNLMFLVNEDGLIYEGEIKKDWQILEQLSIHS